MHDHVKKDVINEDVINEDVINEDVINEDVINEDVINEDVINDDVINDDHAPTASLDCVNSFNIQATNVFSPFHEEMANTSYKCNLTDNNNYDALQVIVKPTFSKPAVEIESDDLIRYQQNNKKISIDDARPNIKPDREEVFADKLNKAMNNSVVNNQTNKDYAKDSALSFMNLTGYVSYTN
jgi:hypothetical protein